MQLRTKRCLIRNFKPEDAEALYQVLSDDEVMKYIEAAYDLEKTRSFLQHCGLCEPPLVYAIVWGATGQVIGHAIFHVYDESDYEIGWILHRDYWGMGIAGEVTEELIAYARHLGAESCIIECDAQQVASKRIAIKHGFVYEWKTESLERYRLMFKESGL